jgi:type IV pilus assembly protein PilB
MKSTRKKKLGESLQERGKISQEDLASAIEEQSGKAVLLGELLLDRNLVSKDDLVSSLEEITRIPYVDASKASPSPEILRLVPAKVARRFCLFPIEKKDNKLVVAMQQPHDLPALTELSFAAGIGITPVFGFRAEIEQAIKKHYSTHEKSGAKTGAGIHSQPQIEFSATTTRQGGIDKIREVQAEFQKQASPAVRLFSKIVIEAAARKASDIHIDPQTTGPVVRIRVDGILRDLTKVEPGLQNSLVSRIKILADMDIAERRAPQDGRLVVRIGDEKRDLRVSTLPTQYGEKVVIRLLDGGGAFVKLQGLGMWPEQADLLAHLLNMPQGMILVTGPTGSGKTTTLYSALNVLRSRALNIITVEDPVEYQLDGVNQVQVNEKAGRTFAASLRSILRQDPNVIMIGEIRDTETAEIGLRAAQTGHMVLSTMHTQDSISAVARLIDLNVPAFLVSSTLSAVIAQRLIRRLCDCRAEVAPSPEYIRALRDTGISEAPHRMYIPAGCPNCENAGYKGRVGIYEILLFEETVCNVVRQGGSPADVRKAARMNGMRSLQEDGLLKASLGITSLEEVNRVVSFGVNSHRRATDTADFEQKFHVESLEE